MKKYKKVAINIAFLTMFLSFGLTNNYLSSINPNQEKILNAFENNDYQTWKKIIGQNNKINNVINESAFQRFVAARIAARNGQYNKALIITEELKKGVENKLS